MLTAENEKRELLPSQKAAMAHASAVSPLTKEQADELIANLSAIDFVDDATAVKITDLLPKYPSDVRAIFSKERITLDAEMIQKILDAVAAYL